MNPHPHSLAQIAAGETVTVERIVFDTIRERCRELGVAEGTRLSCRATDPGQVVLETEAGRAIPCARNLARFIEISGSSRTGA